MVINSVSSVGDANKYAILRLIQQESGISREEVARRLNLSSPTVSKNVSVLCAAGIIYEQGTENAQIGRKPVLLYYNQNIMLVVGAEVMPQGIRGVLANMQGEILASEEMPSEIERGTQYTLENLMRVIDALVASASDPDSVKCMCIASPGCGKTASQFNLLSDYQSDWADVDLPELLGARYHVPVQVMNDVELDLIGEHWLGAGQDSENILLFKCGNGLACRTLLGGKVFSGVNGIAGDIGLFVDSFEHGRSAFALPGAMEKKLCMSLGTSYNSAGGTEEVPANLSLRGLIKLAEKGDGAAQGVLDWVVREIAVLIANSVLVINPEVVILAGDAAYLRERDLDVLKKFLEANCPYPPQLRCAGLRERSSTLGCVITAVTKAETFLSGLWK